MFSSLSTHLAAQLTTAAAAMPLDGFNPFKGVRPSFGPFSGILESKVSMIIALVWASAFVVAAISLIVGFATISRGRRQGVADYVEDGKNTLFWGVIATIGLTIIPVGYAVLIS